MATRTTASLFANAASVVQASDLNPVHYSEAVDSGTATTRGLTWHDSASGWPAATLNQTVEIGEDGTLGTTDVLAGQVYRCIVDTSLAGTDADWAVFALSNSSSSYYEATDITARDALSPNDGDFCKVAVPASLQRWNGTSWDTMFDEGISQIEVQNIDLTPDLSSSLHFMLVTSTTDTRNIFEPITSTGTNLVGNGGIFYIELGAAQFPATFSFESGKYVKADGSDVGDVVIEAADAGTVIANRLLAFQHGSGVSRLLFDNHFVTASNASAERTFETVNQVAHGFSVLQPVYHTGTAWAAAQADNADTVAEGVITSVVDVDNFEVTTHGLATVTSHGLISGEYYWLDQASSAMTATQPTSGIAQSLGKAVGTDLFRVDVGQAMSASGGVVEEDVSSVQMARTSGQSIPQSNVTNIQFNAINWTAGLDLTPYDDTSGDARIVVNTSGRYIINAKGGIDAGGSPLIRSLMVSVNGINIVDHSQSEVAFRPTASTEVSLVAGDEIRMAIYHDDIARNTETTPPGLPTLTVRRVDAKTVIPAAAVDVSINETPNAAGAAYMDMGPVRIQWGSDPLNSDNQETITFPVPFADTSYALMPTLIDDPASATSGGAGADVGTPIRYGSKTTTGFNYNRDDDVDGMNVNWFAIGLKP